MIKITVKIKDHKRQITVSGHAGYGVSGEDIVCAAVSSIVITSVNAILKINPDAIHYESKEGYVMIQVLHEDRTVELLIDNLIDLLTELETDYKKYVKINKEVSSC